jgi:hypothetical protein
VEGEFDGSTLIGSSYTFTEDHGDEKPVVTTVTDSSMYSCYESNGLKYELLGQLAILQAGHYDTGEWGMTATKPGIYFVSYGSTYSVDELVLTTITKIDESYIPDSIARVSQLPEIPQSDWHVFDENNKSYIANRPCYYTGVKVYGEDIPLAAVASTDMDEITVEYDFFEGAMYHVEGTVDVQWPDGTLQTEILSIDAEAGDVYYGHIGLPLEFQIRHPNDDKYIELHSIINYSENCYGFEGHIYYFNLTNGAKIAKLNLHAYALKQLDEMCIPELSHVILKSSTPDSYKKFKVTVNDEGQLTAEEIPEE